MGKWPALEQRDSQIFFQLRHLSADCRLLNSVRDIAHGLANAPVPGHVIKEFQVMDVHKKVGLPCMALLLNRPNGQARSMLAGRPCFKIRIE